MRVQDLMKDNPIIFFDLETTGVEVQSAKIVEIYAKRYNLDGTIDEYYSLFNPEIPIPSDASDVHGITDERVANEPTFKSKSVEIYEFFDGCDLGGYNCIKYDIPVLMEELSNSGIHKFNPMFKRIIDPLKIITKFESNKLSDVYERYFGESLENAHEAKTDIEATIRVFEHLTEKYSDDLNDLGKISKLSRTGGSDLDKVYLDFQGAFYQKDKEVYYGVGKHKNKPVRSEMGFLWWIINKSTFPTNTKIIAKILEERIKERDK